ncbi:UDP-N-acetylmuramoyl-L-alanine--D-glutamate ligase [Candidatus Daviesbacteria bacterium]|nr:UDP-N-acetylmuramoyl-L-alanine--D-glutamate ligase [Candidatus Daviesbacteria bacterium]
MDEFKGKKVLTFLRSKKARFRGTRVLIFGLGLNQGGVGSAKFFAQQGATVRVTDLKSKQILKLSLDQLKSFPNITYTLGEHKNEDIEWADLIIKNPAVKPGNVHIEYARKQGKKVQQDMGIFLDFVKPSQIIGITGTKGKSTIASLIYDVLNKYLAKSWHVKLTHAGHVQRIHTWNNIILAGNIGKSVLDTIPHVKPDTLVVLEISSFQLEAFEQHKVSPKWAVITNITPDHLNYYQTMEEYIQSKIIIGKYQTKSDYLFLKKFDPITSKPNFLKGLKAQIIYFSKEDLPKDFKPRLKGEHNLENIAAAFAITKTFGMDEETILEVTLHFKGISFRMELIKVWNGVKIINDTTATSPEAGIQAIKTFPGCILICGGMNKGMDYTKYATIVGNSVKKVFFLEGDSTDQIKKLMKNKDLIAGTYDDLEKLLIDVKEIVKKGDIILFSPAATSFNLFQNEFDRGRKFNKAVEKVFGANIS